MATGAVGRDDGAALRCEAMIAVEISRDALAGQAELLREAHAFVAAGATIARNVGSGYRRIGILMLLD